MIKIEILVRVLMKRKCTFSVIGFKQVFRLQRDDLICAVFSSRLCSTIPICWMNEVYV